MSDSWNQNPQQSGGPYGQNPNQPPGQPGGPGYGAPGYGAPGYGAPNPGYGSTPSGPPPPPGGMPPGGMGGYPQPSYQPNPYGNDSYNSMVSGEHPDGTKALIVSLIGLLCCWPFAIWSLLIARGAKNSGSSDGKINAAFIISIVAIVLGVIGMIAGGFLTLTGALVDTGTSGGGSYSGW